MTNSKDFESLDILMLTEDFYPETSGGAFEDWNFARISAQRGHNVTVYTPQTQEASESELIQNVKIRRPYRASPNNKHPNSAIGILFRLLYVSLLTIRLIYVSRSTSYDIIYSTNYLLHPVAKVSGLIYRLPVVNHIAYSPSERDEIHWFDFRYLFESLILFLFMGQTVLCRTPTLRRRIEALSRSEVSLVHGILDQELIMETGRSNTNSVRRDLGVNIGDPLLVFVGRLTSLKRPDEAVGVLSELPTCYQLVIVGDGDYRSIVEGRISDYAVDDRVKVLGRCPHDETLEIIAAADVLIATSSVEAYPTVVFEALSLHTSVVSTPVGILPEIDHPKLTLTDLVSMPQRIPGAVEKSRNGFDEETAYRFSIERFTDEVLEAMANATEPIT